MNCCEAVQGRECHCAMPGCHQTFDGMGLFDRHQDVNYTRRPAVICRAPGGLGLAQNARGTWCTPETLKARERSSRRLAAVRSARAPETQVPGDAGR